MTAHCVVPIKDHWSRMWAMRLIAKIRSEPDSDELIDKITGELLRVYTKGVQADIDGKMRKHFPDTAEQREWNDARDEMGSRYNGWRGR